MPPALRGPAGRQTRCVLSRPRVLSLIPLTALTVVLGVFAAVVLNNPPLDFPFSEPPPGAPMPPVDLSLGDQTLTGRVVGPTVLRWTAPGSPFGRAPGPWARRLGRILLPARARRGPQEGPRNRTGPPVRPSDVS